MLIYFFRTKVYHRWDFILNNFSHVLEFWDSKLSGKKKVALDSRVIYFTQFDGDFFTLNFSIGNNFLNIKQYGEDKYNLYIDGNRFKDLMIQEKYERQKYLQDKEKEKQRIKKMQNDYYRRALTYNGNDYYEGKEKILLNNNNNNYNNYNYNNNYNNYGYGYNNNRNNNNRNYPNYYQQNQNNPNQIINQNDINQIKKNISKSRTNNNIKYNNNSNMYNNNNEEINNPYPSFNEYVNTENNAGLNNRPNINNFNTFDNTRNNLNKNNNNNNLMNQLGEVFSKENQIKNSNNKNELPTYSEIMNIQNQPPLNKKNSKENNLESFINDLNLNKKESNNLQPSSIECAPNANTNNNGYNFGFENDSNEMNDNNNNINNNNDNNNQIKLNIHKSKEIENNKKKMFINKSSFQNPLKEEDYDMENPYK